MDTARVAIAVIAKEPALGTVKTRLADALEPRERLLLVRAFLQDRFAQIGSLAGASPWVAFTPDHAYASFAELAGPGVGLLPQRGSHLGERLHHAAEDLFAKGYQAVLLVDGDTPNLPLAFLEEAVRTATRDINPDPPDVILGPAWDGGYYLIGLTQPQPRLFWGIDWSTSRVLSQTVAAAHAAGLSVHFLPSWYDVDTPKDLSRLKRDVSCMHRAIPGYPTYTAQILPSLHAIEPTPTPPPRHEEFRTLSTRRVYQNPWIDVTESVVELERDKLTLYGVITCSACVGVLPFLDDDQVLLVKQFRYVARRTTYEIPTGGVHAGESLEAAAQRELAEECGYTAKQLRHLSTFHTSKSVMDEVAHLYIGEGLERASRTPDETEHIDVHPVPFEEAVRMVTSGEIVDAMSVIAILTAQIRRKSYYIK